MADMSIVGAVAVRVRPDATGFREELRRDVMRELRGYAPEVEVEARLADSGRELKRDVDKAARRARTDVKIGINETFLKRDLARVKAEMDRLGEKSVEIGLKTDKLDKALAEQRNAFAEVEKYKLRQVELDKQLSDSAEALASAQKRVADAQAQMAEGRNVARAEKAYREAAKAVQGLEKNLARLKKQQAENNDALEESLARQRELAGELADQYEDAQELLEAQEASHAKQTSLLKEQLELERNMNTVRTGSREQVQAMLKDQQKEGETLGAVLDRLLRTADELDSKEFASLREWAKNDFSRDRVAKLRVEADTAVAEAELQALERSRTVRIIARTDSALTRLSAALRSGGQLDTDLDNIKQKYRGMFAGGALAVSGVNTVRAMTTYMATSAQHADKLAVSSALMSQALTAGLGTVAATTGLLGKTAVDLAAIVKGAALAPAALVAVGVAAGTSARALKTLGDALGGNVEELESVAPAAVPATNAIRDLFVTADSVGKGKFFAELLEQLERMPVALGPLASLWERAYASQGRFFSGVLSGVDDWHNAGDMAQSVKNIGDSLDEAATAGKPLTQSLLDLVTVGSQYLPQLGRHMSRLSGEWAGFIREAKETGRINKWIEESGRQLTYLGGVAKGTAGLIGGIGRAAENAGIGGLKSFSDGLQAASRAVNSDLWQGGLTRIFRGASDGATAAGRGIGELGRNIMATAGLWEHFGRVSGQTVGTLASHLGRMLTGSRFLPGLKSMFDDVNVSVASSETLFRNVGDAMGDGALLGGKLFSAGMQIVDAFFRAWAASDKLTSGLADFIPVAGSVASGLVSITHALASPLLDGLGRLLSAVSGLPQPALLAVTALGLFAGVLFKLRRAGEGSALAGIGAQFPLLGAAAEMARGKVESFRGGWSHMTGLLRNGASFETASRHLQLMGRSFDSMGRNAGQAALGASQLRGALGGSHFDTAAGSAGRFSTALQGVGNIGVAGLRGALGGLVGFLGGPWGIAFVAAGAVLGTLASDMAKSKQQVQELQTSLDEMGNVTLQTARQIASGFESHGNWMSNFKRNFNQWVEDTFRGGEAFIWDFKRAAEATGKSIADLGQDVATSGGNWSEYRQALEEAVELTKSGNSLTEEQAQKLFGTSEAAKVTADTFQALRSEWDAQNNAVKEAQQKQREYAEALGLTTRESSALKKALETVNNEHASTAQRAQASKDAIDLMNGSTRSYLGSLNSQESAMGNLAQAFGEVAKAGKGGAGAFVEYTNALGESSWRLNTAVSELRQLDSALSQSYDAAVNHAQAIYDNARAHGDTQAEAAAKANASLAEWRASASAQLQQLGVDAKQAEAYLQDIAGKPWTAEVLFMGKTEEYMRAQESVEKAGKSFNGQAFTAFLKANPDAGVEAIEALIAKGVNWSSAVYEASLLADGTDAQAALDEIIARGQDLDESEFQAILDGDESPFLDAVIAAKAAGEDLNSSEWAARFGIDDTEFQAIRQRALQEGEEFGSREWVARLDLENPGFAEKFYAAEASLKGLTGQEWLTYIQSNADEVRKAQDDLTSSLVAMNGTTATVTVVSNAATEAAVAEAYRLLLQGMDGQEVMNHLKMNPDEWNTVVDALPGQWESKKVQVENSPVHLDANHSKVTERMAEAGSSLAHFTQNAKGTATLDGNKAPLDGAIASGQAQGAQFSLQRFVSTLDGNNAPMGTNVRAAQGMGGGFASQLFTATLSGNSHPMTIASMVATRSGHSFARPYTGTLKAINHAGHVVRGLVQSAWDWGGKVFTATFRAVTSKLGFADGGIVNGAGVQTFATGGVTYAKENHRAFIARPSSTFRVWAEPETGGEAYIPLASSKRSRSTQILGHVADQFGLTVTKHFADGGFEHVGGRPVSAPVGSYPGGMNGVSAAALARGVRAGLAGTQLNISHGGEVSFSLAAERGRLRSTSRR